MKLLFDENLSPRLARVLADLFPGSAHVHECGLGSADDASVWRYAQHNGFTIASKDSDFQDLSILHGQPPKLIWLRVANCGTRDIETLLRAAAQTIKQFIDEDAESCLVLGPRRRPASTKRKVSGAP